MDDLTTMAAGAALGITGQLTRGVVGLYKARRAGVDFTFDGLLFSLGLVLGGVAGAAAAWAGGLGHAQVPTAFLAGYAGADFIEAGFK